MPIQELHRRVGHETAFHRAHRKVGRALENHFGRTFDLRMADVVPVVERLPVQVALVDPVVIDDSDVFDAASRKELKHRRTEATRADD
jgi:hypothetical protein